MVAFAAKGMSFPVEQIIHWLKTGTSGFLSISFLNVEFEIVSSTNTFASVGSSIGAQLFSCVELRQVLSSFINGSIGDDGERNSTNNGREAEIELLKSTKIKSMTSLKKMISPWRGIFQRWLVSLKVEYKMLLWKINKLLTRRNNSFVLCGS